MALTRTQQGPAHEIWVQDDPTTFGGGSAAVTITTDIRTITEELDHTRIRLYLHNISGFPTVAAPTATLVPVSPTIGYWNVLQISFQNTSSDPLDQASWSLEIERIWSAAR